MMMPLLADVPELSAASDVPRVPKGLPPTANAMVLRSTVTAFSQYA